MNFLAEQGLRSQRCHLLRKMVTRRRLTKFPLPLGRQLFSLRFDFVEYIATVSLNFASSGFLLPSHGRHGTRRSSAPLA